MLAIFWILTIVLALGATVWKGYVLTVLWTWFLIPAFSFPVLSVPVAIGIVFIVTLLVYAPKKHKTKTASDIGVFAGTVFAHGYFLPLISLGLGYIVKQFM